MYTVKDLYFDLENTLDYVDRMTNPKYKQDYSLDYWKGFLYGTERMLHTKLYDAVLPKPNNVLTFEITEKDAEKYAYDEDWVADERTVAINNMIYKQMNPDIELLEEGKTYHSHVKACGLLTFGDEKYPVYNDDAGQCEYIRLDGENFSGGAYNFTPEYDFIGHIISHKIYQKMKELEKRFEE